MPLLSRGSGNLFLPLIIIPFILLFSGCRKDLEPAAAWQAKVIRAHGGTASLRKVDSITYSGRIKTRDDAGTVDLILARPGRLRALMRYGKRTEDRILLGNRGWRNFGSGFEEAVDQSLAAMVFQYNHVELPMGLVSARYGVSFSEREIEDRTYPVLELTREGDPPMRVSIDPDTGLIHRVDGLIQVGNQKIIMGVGYDDYREVAGVMLPHRLVNYVNGSAIAESSYDTVSVNSELARDAFSQDRSLPQQAVE